MSVHELSKEFQYLLLFLFLREAAKPIFEADQHAKKELKKQVRRVRPIERALKIRSNEQAEAMHGYCLTVCSAITDDGRPSLRASRLALHERLVQISDSFAHMEGKGASSLAETVAAPAADGLEQDSGDNCVSAKTLCVISLPLRHSYSSEVYRSWFFQLLTCSPGIVSF